VWKQQYDNLAALSEDRGDVRILAVGESTTAVAGNPEGTMLVPWTAWPAQLEKLLNASGDGRTYRVWNNGMMGGTSSESLELLESTLPVVDPHIIIVMMGIKDTPDELMPYFNDWPRWLRTSHTVQLAAWLIDGRALSINAHVTDIRELADLPPNVRRRRSHNGVAIQETGILEHPGALDQARVAVYLTCIGRLSQAEAIAREIVARTDTGHNLLARIVFMSGRPDEAIEALHAVAERHPEEPMYAIMEGDLRRLAGDLDGAAEAIARGHRRATAQVHSGVAGASYALAMAHFTEAERLLELERWADARAHVLALQTVPDPVRPFHDVFPPPTLLQASLLGRAALGSRDWKTAERYLLEAIEIQPEKMVNLYLLSQVYRETNRTAKEAEIRQRLLKTSGRMAEYFELAKLFRLTGEHDRAREIIAQAVEDIPSLRQNMRTLYEIAERDGIRLVVMQYPGFSVSALEAYAPPRSGVSHIDQEHLFDADPDAYFFEPTYPNSFSHYTEAGAVKMANEILPYILAIADGESD
jgi:tetratricopeptide (TPR) repeat protein